MKKAVVSICIVLVLLSCALLLFACDDAPSRREIAEQCIRIHIRANSNSKTDQAVKLKVRDEVT
ncbi:MAG TPA: stage II sporulation protein R, partial [Clostridiales bacterium]|nr:stage II sporulation protein R [Clostridiales bacterium]